jgi:hypothetical protein
MEELSVQNEFTAVWALVCLTAFTAAAQAQAVDPVGSTVVYDANFKIIGSLIGITFPSPSVGFVRLRISGAGYEQSSVVVSVGRPDLPTASPTIGTVTWFADDVSFESTDCTGTPYAPADETTPIAERAAIIDAGHMLYVSDIDPAPLAVTTRSFLPSDGGRCIALTGSSPRYFVLHRFVNLDQLFVPPFSIGEYGRRRVVGEGGAQ